MVLILVFVPSVRAQANQVAVPGQKYFQADSQEGLGHRL